MFSNVERDVSVSAICLIQPQNNGGWLRRGGAEVVQFTPFDGFQEDVGGATNIEGTRRAQLSESGLLNVTDWNEDSDTAGLDQTNSSP